VVADSERPWWRDWRRLDPWSERLQSRPLPAWRLWVARTLAVGAVLWAVVAIVIGAWSTAVGVITWFCLMVLFMPAHHRKQVIGR
jgi:ABC-type multidrug transport system permease subunit